ncbi:rod shape-determining protein MreD [Nocardioides sp. Bht2]|uniref:rod shape-determining protein MreD n=1 Tax=Nocardioides sp. Bht2 TaxID=3392297 RepID=UPI0039B5F7EF
MSLVRAGGAAIAVVVAVVLQVTVFSHLAWDGVVPNVALLVVVAAALVRGPQFGALVGFAAGVLVDLAPPADHLAGRWALALVIVGFMAGLVRQESRITVPMALGTVAAASFVGTSIFAISGLILDDGTVGVVEMLQVIGIGMVWDVALTPLLLPLTMALFRRIDPPRFATW